MTGLLIRGDLAVLEGFGLDGQLLLEVGVAFIGSVLCCRQITVISL